MNHFKSLSKATLIIFSALVFSGCKKEIIPPPGSAEPVFKAEGTFNGQDISLRAGDDDVLMETQVQEINGVHFFSGTLGNSNIELEMGVYAGDLDKPQSESAFSGMSSINFAYEPGQPLYTLCKDSLLNASSILKVMWEVNGAIYPEQDVLNIYEPGKYTICAHVVFSDYSESMLCNEVLVGFRQNADFAINFMMGQDLTFQSWISPISGTVSNINWYINGQVISNQQVLGTHLNSGEYIVTAEVFFTNGVKLSRNILIDGNLTGHNIYDFTQSASILPLKWDYTAKLKLKKDGVEYFSDKALNSTNKISVSEIKYHGMNSKGKAVYLLKGTVDANLKSASGTSTFPLQLNVSFGFAVE